MFGLGIHYLNGWAMAAADGAKKERAEWPPHPDRVFMAMAAAWFETGEDPEEKKALEWIETLPPPSIAASDAKYRHEMKGRYPVTSYVPVNDASVSKKIPETQQLDKLKEAGLNLLPEHRLRQARRFPVAVPHDPFVHLIWEADIADDRKGPLVRICRKVSSVGHSASFVQMWLAEAPPPPTLIPASGVTRHRLRVPGSGKLAYLKARCNREAVILHRDSAGKLESLKQGKKEIDALRKAAIKGMKGEEKKMTEAPFKQQLKEIKSQADAAGEVLESFQGRVPNTLRPEPGLWQGYQAPEAETAFDVPGGFFDPALIVLTLSGKRLPLPSTLRLTGAFRKALMSAIADPVPEWISGHRKDKSCSRDPHMAVFPLPFLGHEHADGKIMGIAVAFPRAVEKAEVGRYLEPWLRDEFGQPRPVRLFDGKWFECAAELEIRELPPLNLRPRTWTRPSALWASVTPVVLDRHFDGKDKWERAAEVVKDSCERIGLPRPEKVLLHTVSWVQGAPHSRDFPPIQRKSDGGRMHHCHAVIVFSEPVAGPMIVGAGRFRGYGLMRPMPHFTDRKEAHNDGTDT